MSAIEDELFSPRNTFGIKSAPAFTAINHRPTSIPSRLWTKSNCSETQESVPRGPDPCLATQRIELECPRGANKCDRNNLMKTKAWNVRPVEKRKFTRTGCGTCRKRKKKCDEAKPNCNNCLRGNYECAGYAKQILLSSKSVTRAAPQLQSHGQTFNRDTTSHLVKCLVCNVIHIPHCGPSQKPYGVLNASSGLGTSRDRPPLTEEQDCKPS
jgi:hypothetical protein